MPDIDLHPGALVALARSRMTETQVAKAIAAGELTSPQPFANSWYFAIRISGTGGAYRIGLKEFVWRDPTIYLNPEFLQRCNGLPVIIEHPERMMLNSAEYRRRNIGSIVLPYIKGEEVWGIARVLDQAAAQYMRDHDLSTSPGVVFGNPEISNEVIEASNGQHLLIEGTPQLLDHVAICDEGVWDKGGPPTGVDTQGAKESEMAEEEMDRGAKDRRDRRDELTAEGAEKAAEALKAKDDRARDDAAARRDEKLDKLLEGIKVLSDRMDSIEARHGRADDEDEETEQRQAAELRKLAAEEEASAIKEAEEEASAAEDAARDDRARRDAKFRDDARKRLDAACRKFDAACSGMRGDSRSRADGLRKRMDDAADMLRGEDDRKDRRDAKRDDGEDDDKMPWEEMDRKDGEEDEEYSNRAADAATRHDAQSYRKRDDESFAAHCDRVARGARRDRARRADRARMDSIDRLADTMNNLLQRVDRLSQVTAERSPEDENKFAEAQARADSVFQAHGESAPRSLAGQNLMGYRIMLARNLQKHSEAWKNTDLALLARTDSAAFANVETQIYADAVKAADAPLGVEFTGLREFKRTLEGGHKSVEFKGNPLSWMATFMSTGQTTTRLRPKQ